MGTKSANEGCSALVAGALPRRQSNFLLSGRAGCGRLAVREPGFRLAHGLRLEAASIMVEPGDANPDLAKSGSRTYTCTSLPDLTVR